MIHALNIGRSTEETRRVLAALQTRGLCPSNWRPGGKHPAPALEELEACCVAAASAALPSLAGATAWIGREPTPDELCGRAVLVHFWALSCHLLQEGSATCRPCARLRERFARRSVTFVSIHMPRQESDTSLSRPGRRRGPRPSGSPSLALAVDGTHALGDRFETGGFWPAYFLFDADGKLRTRAGGAAGLGVLEGALGAACAPPPR